MVTVVCYMCYMLASDLLTCTQPVPISVFATTYHTDRKYFYKVLLIDSAGYRVNVARVISFYQAVTRSLQAGRHACTLSCHVLRVVI